MELEVANARLAHHVLEAQDNETARHSPAFDRLLLGVRRDFRSRARCGAWPSPPSVIRGAAFRVRLCR